MIFVDTNVLMYAVGRPHPLRSDARVFFEQSLKSGAPLATSSEVLQELLQAYLPVQRLATLDAALELANSLVPTVWPVEGEDVRFARSLIGRYPELTARDLIHVSCCRRRGVTEVKTFDRALGAAFARR